jgi:hypothetical protein
LTLVIPGVCGGNYVPEHFPAHEIERSRSINSFPRVTKNTVKQEIQQETNKSRQTLNQYVKQTKLFFLTCEYANFRRRKFSNPSDFIYTLPFFLHFFHNFNFSILFDRIRYFLFYLITYHIQRSEF